QTPRQAARFSFEPQRHRGTEKTRRRKSVEEKTNGRPVFLIPFLSSCLHCVSVSLWFNSSSTPGVVRTRTTPADDGRVGRFPLLARLAALGQDAGGAARV